jgi:hypothetical protein
MMAVFREFNRHSQVKKSTEEIWQHLSTMYDLEALDDMVMCVICV